MEKQAFYIKATKEQIDKIRDLAEKESCSVSDLVLSKVLEIPLVENKLKIYTESARKYQPKRKKVLPT